MTDTPNSFSKLKRSMISKVILIVLGSVAVGLIFLIFFVDGIFQNAFSEAMINFFRMLGFDNDDANYLYFTVFMNKKTVWMLTGLLIIMAIAFYFTLSRFTKYFDQVSDGVDKLVKDDSDAIRLSPELDFMEDKLNEVKEKLTRKEQEAKEAEQRKNDLVVYLAHDIKTPLTSVVGYLNLLNEDPDLPIESRAKYTKITLEKAYRLEELINEFFDITRFNLQSIVLDKTKVDMSLMLRQIADEFYPSLEEKKLKLELDIDENMWMEGDSQKLARVFNNIIKNAISYSNENESILIYGHINHDSMEFSISNKGERIPQNKLDTIFEKFYRLDISRSTNKGGSGLGLAIAKEIVIAHGGKIAAESNDELTTFKILLPSVL